MKRFETSCVDPSFEFAPLGAWNALAGDANGDGDYFERDLFGREIDALLVLRGGTQTSMRQLFVSTKAGTGTAVSGPPVHRPGDVARLVRDGRWIRFLTAIQIRDAFGITAPASQIDVDAIAQDDAGNVLLSLENTRTIHVDHGTGGLTSYTAGDGAILLIPAAEITYTASGIVQAVNPNQGILALNEGQINATVAASGIGDGAGFCADTIGDLDALEIDQRPNGQLLIQTPEGIFALPHLLFAGESLTGLGVVSTAGDIASIGPAACPLGAPCPAASSGIHLGADGYNHSLNALAAVEEDPPCPFVIDTCEHEWTGALCGTSWRLDIAGRPGPTAIQVHLGPSGPGGIAPTLHPATVPFAVECFPHVVFDPARYITAFPVGSDVFSIPSLGCGGTYHLVWQATAIAPSGALALSAPTVLQF